MTAHNSSSSTPRSAESTPARNIDKVILGNLLFQTWFHSLYPEDLVGKGIDRLYVCQWCFRYTCDEVAYTGHTPVCDCKHTPPGLKIYEYGGYSVWEIDGEDNKLYAQNLSLFAKLFLDHKSVFYDVSSFLYYILVYSEPRKTNDDDDGSYRVLGYFSKEKLSWDQNNLACILIFPPYQHKQLGKLLMGISYKLSAWEWEGGIIGGPERPLSEMGRRSYVRFWEERIARYFLLGPPGSISREAIVRKAAGSKGAKGGKKKPVREQMTIREIGQATGMLVEDVITALKEMGVVEPEKPGKKRKRVSATGAKDDVETAVIRKHSVLEWAKNHRVSLQDPVQEEGFLGEWAPESARETDDDE
ncbi:hypothetical protein AJ80_04400 [Polytolypa hystricis UAMH7299]|uniref:histone acetyltransferase n=1 Tax=Polytolypa hystricis (strain UAMH7299) TaxID=1447883 RepID=A0A2B7YC95_POLH7|nr:hypothetical protein AJ80_04400 [Polytolypa hystricis UAMH7299]